MSYQFESMSHFYGKSNNKPIPCPQCGQLFKPTKDHAWKVGKRNKETPVCTYKCVRDWEKENEDKYKY